MNYEIKYDRKSKDYSVTVGDNFLGYASCYVEGEMMAQDYITEQAEIEARAVSASIEAQLTEQGLRRAESDEAGWYALAENEYGNTIKVWATDEAPALPATFSATSTNPLDAMLNARSQAESLINRLGDEVISRTDEVTISVRGRPLTTVVVVVAPRLAGAPAPMEREPWEAENTNSREWHIFCAMNER